MRANTFDTASEAYVLPESEVVYVRLEIFNVLWQGDVVWRIEW